MEISGLNESAIMKRIFALIFLLSACVASDETGYEMAFAEPPTEVVPKICETPENLGISSYTPPTRGQIDSRYKFFLGKGVESGHFILMGGFEDDCLRYVSHELAIVFSVDGLKSVLVDTPMFVGFPTLQRWFSRKSEAGEDFDEYFILSSDIHNFENSGRRWLIFGPKGLEVGAAKLGQQQSIVISER